MRIQMGTAHVDAVELVNGKLQVNLADGREMVLLGNVQDFAAARWGQETHMVVFDHGGAAWHFHGHDSFASGKLELEHEYGGGSRLVTDDTGRLHLIYLTQPIKGQGAALRHQVYAGEWGKPMLISTHVRSDKWGFSACWEQGGFLHLAYLSHGDGHLLYRVYNDAQKAWSGAVPLWQEPCQQPQFFPGTKLVLAWLGGKASWQVQMMEKGESWSKIRTVSHPLGACAALGCAFDDDELYLLWRQSDKLWKLAPLVKGEEPVEADSALYSLAMEVIVDRQGAALTAPVYRPQAPAREQLDPPAKPEQPKAEQAKDAEGRETVEKQLQTALLEQAFRIQMEWETLRGEYANVQRLISALETQLHAELKAMSDRIGHMPKGKLDAVLQRVERLEIRLTKYERDWREWQTQAENRLARLEQASLAANRRISALENPEPKPSIWHRLWRW